MPRLAVATCLVLAGFVALAAGANAADDVEKSTSQKLSERFERFRRSIWGDSGEQAHHNHQHHQHHNHNHHHTPRTAANPRQGQAPAAGRTQAAGRPQAHAGRQPHSSRRPDPAAIFPDDQLFPDLGGTSQAVDHFDDPPPVYAPAVERERYAWPEEQNTPTGGTRPAYSARPGALYDPGARVASRVDRATGPIPAMPPEDGDLLFARTAAVLRVETSGPRRVVLGKPATYRVVVSNDADVVAEGVVLELALPAWAEVVDARQTNGKTSLPAGGSETFQWTINSLSGRSQAELTLQIVPRENRPFDLALRWSSAGPTSQATIEVQQPQLVLKLAGPKEVQCGAKEIYRLSLVNPGTGAAENVVVRLFGVGPDQAPASSHRIGTIEPNDAKVVDIELAARQGGQLVIKAEATADGGLQAAIAEEVIVRRAKLEVKVTGPSKQFAAAPGNFRIHVANPGDAPARQVRLSAALPPLAEYISSTAGGQLDADPRRVNWLIDHLPAGGEATLDLKCNIRGPGENRIDVVAAAEGDLVANGTAVTQVVALPDLELAVTDPPAPVAVGEDAVFEVRVRNRGTKSAEGVELVAFFSKGIEPVSVEGGPHEISPGTVALGTISSLAAGADAVYRITARADVSGNHRFRVELECKSASTRLSQEETTLFYGEETLGKAGKEPPRKQPQAASGPEILTMPRS
ncbi:MAG: hypothetical protein WD278_02745 [Pirellulales bacterium]